METKQPDAIWSGLDSHERDDLALLCFRARPRTPCSMARMEKDGLVVFLRETASGTTWFAATPLGRAVMSAARAAARGTK